jgi:hypothetical protein
MTDEIKVTEQELRGTLVSLNIARLALEEAKTYRDGLITHEYRSAENIVKTWANEEARITKIVRDMGTTLYPEGTEKGQIPGIQVVMRDEINYDRTAAIDYCNVKLPAMLKTVLDDSLFSDYVKSLIKSGTWESELPFVQYAKTPFTNISKDLSDVTEKP